MTRSDPPIFVDDSGEYGKLYVMTGEGVITIHAVSCIARKFVVVNCSSLSL